MYGFSSEKAKEIFVWRERLLETMKTGEENPQTFQVFWSGMDEHTKALIILKFFGSIHGLSEEDPRYTIPQQLRDEIENIKAIRMPGVYELFIEWLNLGELSEEQLEEPREDIRRFGKDFKIFLKTNMKLDSDDLEMAWEIVAPDSEMYMYIMKKILELGDFNYAVSFLKKNIGYDDSMLRDEIIKKMDINSPSLADIWFGADSLWQEKHRDIYPQVIKVMNENPDKKLVIWCQMSEQDKIKYLDFFDEILKSAKGALETFDQESLIDFFQYIPISVIKEYIKRCDGIKDGEWWEEFVIEHNLDLKLTVKNVADLTFEELMQIQAKFPFLKKIKVQPREGDDAREETYDIDTFSLCRLKIDKILAKVSKISQDDPDREKKIFVQVIRNLAKNRPYNYNAYHIIEEVREINRQLERVNMSEANKKKLEEKRDELIKSIDYTTCSTLEGALIHKTCVCSGYANMVKAVFTCCGIETLQCGGNTKKSEDGRYTGHAWNQIKLDGVWYNFDLTWLREAIEKGNIFAPVLQSDEDFNAQEFKDYKGGHGEYLEGRTNCGVVCEKTITLGELFELLNEKVRKKKDEVEP